MTESGQVVRDIGGPDLTKRVPSSDREREDLSIDVKHDSVR